MKKAISGLIFLAATVFLGGCDKETDPQPPVISLNAGSAYTPDKAVIRTGGRLYFGITARAGSENITNLVVMKVMPDGRTVVVLDSGMNSTGFSVNETFYQSVEDTAVWTFQLMDKNRLFATASLTLYRDPASEWGGIYDFPLLEMGYQDNLQYGQFLCCKNGRILSGDSASLIPDSVDIATYFYVDDNLPSPTFSSPGEYGGGILEYYPFIDSWTAKNYTKWDISVDSDPLPAEAFDQCHNDSLLILSYDDVWGKRKFKWAEPGDIIPFMTAYGKKGLIKVISADEDPAGSIRFSMKVQQ